MKYLKNKILISIASLLLFSVLFFFLLLNNTSLVKPEVNIFYKTLKTTLKQRGYKPELVVVSTKRHKWLNGILVLMNGASKNSRHMKEEAIDFIVLDINGDGESDSTDLDIVYNILDKEIIKNKGGIGTYKNEKSFFNRQMIHIDCRGFYKRWEKSTQ